MEFPEKVLLALKGGTLARLDALRPSDEDRRAFLRKLVEREIRRLERRPTPPPKR